MQMSKELVDIITQHLSWVDNIPRINYGGCGYVALSLYDMFRRIGFKPQIYAIDYAYREDRQTWKETTNSRRNNLKAATVVAHYVVRVGDYFFDSRGGFHIDEVITDFGPPRFIQKPIFKSDLIWALRYGEWNNTFLYENDSNVVRRIRKHIRSFEQVNNSNHVG